jgi:hypothetical protein
VRDEAADRHPGVAIKQRQDGIPNRAADILEIDIDVIRIGRRQGARKPTRPMVDSGIKPELIRDIGAFVGASGNPDRPRTCDAGEPRPRPPFRQF